LFANLFYTDVSINILRNNFINNENKVNIIKNNDKYECEFCNIKFKKIDKLDKHLKKECNMLISFNNIYDFNINTFGKKIYGNNGGEIYIIQTDQSNKNYFKIGITSNIIRRLKEYRCGSILEPRLYYYYPCKNIRKVDKVMKNKLKKYRIKREIYKADLNDLRVLIKEIQNINSEILEYKPIIKKVNLSECKFCNKLFESESLKKMHLQKCKKYLLKKNKNKICRHCGKTFTTYKSKWRHEKKFCKKKNKKEDKKEDKLLTYLNKINNLIEDNKNRF
jgi:hypothetical protein